MLPLPSFTSVRNHAINEFNTLQGRAWRNSWLAKILKRNNHPRNFAANGTTRLPGKHLAGIHTVQVEKIVGTMHRGDDFDQYFRPLKKHLRERWVNALLRLDHEGWEPIQVHKVGDSYFVQDGHHRVSVAKSIGITFIEAEVWDHSPQQPRRNLCIPKRKPLKRRAEAYSTNS